MNSHALPDTEDPFAPASPPAPSSQSPASPSSIMSMSPTLASRLSFQTLTNFIPMPSLPWSPRSRASATAAAAAALCFIPEGASHSSAPSDASVSSTFVNAPRPAPVQPEVAKPSSKDKAYVQREKQLEKLRLRLEDERRVRRPGVASGAHGKMQGAATRP